MESNSGDEFEPNDEHESTVQDEKIFVAVRLRPLNEKEISKNDLSDWECINNNTIVFKNNQSERTTHPNMYSFDRVYDSDTSTKHVYEEGVKGIALSVLNGINSTIFAYGQTSSGKTFTMSGITNYTIADIYDYMNKQIDREFVLKFSAIEIYNECVKDLLSSDGAQLRLLDDPDKGTVVEKLTEVCVKDDDHIKELIYLCEAERQIGETALNEMSSRSHQILRLTVESSPIEYKGDDNGRTLVASVNFVDLAGSERASQTLAAGTRLKEGCHINRSLLTLGTVVRKLSKKGSGHVPYRNSKLTRILHNSLGGNARTAILCTICPAHSHVEQSRNTLLFASCAKDVSTNAQVNVVTSDKALVKQLQQELARLENELRMFPASNESASIIKDMELQIKKMEKEVDELIQERDLAQSRLEDLIRLTGIDRNSLPWDVPSHVYKKDENGVIDPLTFDASLNNNHLSNMEDSKISVENHHFVDEKSPQETIMNSTDSYKEYGDIEKTLDKDDNFIKNPKDNYGEDEVIEKTSSMYANIMSYPEANYNADRVIEETLDDNITGYPEANYYEDQVIEKTSNMDDDIVTNLQNNSKKDQQTEETPSIDNNITINLEENSKQDQQVSMKTSSIEDNVAESVEYYKEDQPNRKEPSSCSSDSDTSDSKGIGITRSKSCKELTTNSLTPTSGKEMMTESINDNGFDEDFSGKQIITKSKSETDAKGPSKQDSDSSEDEDINEKKKEQKIKSPTEGDVNSSDHSSTARSLNELMALESEVESSDKTVKQIKPNANEPAKIIVASDKGWSMVFEKQRRDIIKLWDECNTPLIHRTYFFLLFNGDPSDSVYMEVEFRRLSFLKKTPSRLISAKALNRERISLSKMLLKKFSSSQRDTLFRKWGISLDSKHRRVQLCQLVWTKTDDLDHIKSSAELVAQIVGIVELNHTPKELFGLSFLPKPTIYKTSFWKASMSFG